VYFLTSQHWLRVLLAMLFRFVNIFIHDVYNVCCPNLRRRIIRHRIRGYTASYAGIVL